MARHDPNILAWARQQWVLVLCASILLIGLATTVVLIQSLHTQRELRAAAREKQLLVEEDNRRQLLARLAEQEEEARRQFEVSMREEFRDELLDIMAQDKWHDSPDAASKSMARDIVTGMVDNSLQVIYDMFTEALGSTSSIEAYDLIAQSIINVVSGIVEPADAEIDAFRVALMSTLQSEEFRTKYTDEVIEDSVAALSMLTSNTWRMRYMHSKDGSIQEVLDDVIAMASQHVQQSAERETEILLQFMGLMAAGLNENDAIEKLAQGTGVSVAEIRSVLSKSLDEIELELAAARSKSRQQPMAQESVAIGRIVIGLWNDAVSSITIEFFKDNGEHYMRRRHRDGSSAVDRLTIRRVHGQTQYWDRPGNRFGDHYIIDAQGRLELRDSSGLIRRLNPTR